MLNTGIMFQIDTQTNLRAKYEPAWPEVDGTGKTLTFSERQLHAKDGVIVTLNFGFFGGISTPLQSLKEADTLTQEVPVDRKVTELFKAVFTNPQTGTVSPLGGLALYTYSTDENIVRRLQLILLGNPNVPIEAHVGMPHKRPHQMIVLNTKENGIETMDIERISLLRRSPVRALLGIQPSYLPKRDIRFPEAAEFLKYSLMTPGRLNTPEERRIEEENIARDIIHKGFYATSNHLLGALSIYLEPNQKREIIHVPN
jgi:hypothetical protein